MSHILNTLWLFSRLTHKREVHASLAALPPEIDSEYSSTPLVMGRGPGTMIPAPFASSFLFDQTDFFPKFFRPWVQRDGDTFQCQVRSKSRIADMGVGNFLALLIHVLRKLVDQIL